jgi:hypothetical protein
VAEVLVSFTAPTKSRGGDLYWGRAMGRLAPDGMWQGWVEFVRAGDDEVVNTGRETSQPTHADLRYWALGLTQTFLEGALNRALSPAPQLASPEPRIHVDSAPRSAPPRSGSIPRRVILDPFATFVQGEDLLRSQLMALSPDDLLNIVEAYRFPPTNKPVAAHQSAIVEQIVAGVRARYEAVAGDSVAPERVKGSPETRPDAT